MTASLTILFLVLMFLGMPVAFAIGVSFMLFYLLGPAPAMISVQKIVVSTQNFPLLAIPLFIFAGHLMNHSGITERLIKLSTVMTGWISGGLAHAVEGSDDEGLLRDADTALYAAKRGGRDRVCVNSSGRIFGSPATA